MMVSAFHFENWRPLVVAVMMFALVGGLSFAWAAVETQKASVAPAPAPAPEINIQTAQQL